MGSFACGLETQGFAPQTVEATDGIFHLMKFRKRSRRFAFALPAAEGFFKSVKQKLRGKTIVLNIRKTGFGRKNTRTCNAIPGVVRVCLPGLS